MQSTQQVGNWNCPRKAMDVTQSVIPSSDDQWFSCKEATKHAPLSPHGALKTVSLYRPIVRVRKVTGLSVATCFSLPKSLIPINHYQHWLMADWLALIARLANINARMLRFSPALLQSPRSWCKSDEGQLSTPPRDWFPHRWSLDRRHVSPMRDPAR
jgi:hypothetical protein